MDVNIKELKSSNDNIQKQGRVQPVQKKSSENNAEIEDAKKGFRLPPIQMNRNQGNTQIVTPSDDQIYGKNLDNDDVNSDKDEIPVETKKVSQFKSTAQSLLQALKKQTISGDSKTVDVQYDSDNSKEIQKFDSEDSEQITEELDDQVQQEDSNKENQNQWYDQEELPDDPSIFIMHGKEHVFSRRSVWLLRNNNRLRRAIVWIITHKRFDHLIVLLILINALLLGIKDYTDTKNETPINQFVESMEPVFVISFTIECALKILGMGFILDAGSYLRDAWNWLDFIVVISSLLTAVPQMKSVSGMRTFRLMRPLRSLTTMPSMKILISTLLASVSQLGGVVVLALFFFTIFAILGVSLWAGSIHRRCRLTEFPVNGDWVPDPDDFDLCSSVRKCPANRWCGSLPEAYRAYQAGNERYFIDINLLESRGESIKRDNQIEELNFGYSSFDSIIVAFITIFQCVTLEGWIDITNIYQDAYGKRFVQFYFLLCIIVCSFFVLNLTIAVMLLKYEELDKSEKSSTHLEELRVYGNQIGKDGLPESFTNFIIDQDNIQISAKGLKILKNQKQEDNSWRQMIKSSATFEETDNYYKNPVTRACFYIVNSPIFNGFILFVIVANTVVLSMDKFPDHNQKIKDVFAVMNTTFTIIFTVEVVIKIIGVGARGFVQDKFNIFDAAIVLISLIELLANHTKVEGGHEDGDEGEGGGGGAFSALRAFRLFRVFKLFKAGDLRTLLDGIAFTVLAVGDYCILLGLFIYVFALLGMSMFAGKVRFDENGDIDVENGESPRANYDSVGWASLSVFFVMIGENWNATMYDHMRAVGPAACIYFVTLVMFGGVVMLNLFLAILLGNFDRARNFGEKKKIFDAFDSLAKMGYKLNISIAYLFDDQDLTRYIEEKILHEKLGENTNSTGKKLQKENVGQEKDDDPTDIEMRQLYCAMTTGTINQILSGERQLDEEPWEDFPLEDIPDHQKEKTQEILIYIKRQTNLRSQKREFENQVKLTQEQRDILEEMDQKEEDLSSDSEESVEAKSPLEQLLDHFQNSSLLIFHQSNVVRQWCQKCVVSDDDDAQVQTKTQKSDSMVDESAVDSLGSPKKRMARSQSTQNEQTQKLTISPDVKPKKGVAPVTQNQGQPGQGLTRSSTTVQVYPKKALPTGKATEAKIFEGIIMTLIIISSIMLAIDTPLLNPEAPGIVFAGYLDNCFTILFTIECLIKVIALGFLFNNATLREKGISPYMRDPWNMLDFVVVVASLLDFVVTVKSSMSKAGENSGSQLSSSLQSVKALRALRALRPLRMISRNQGMKLIVNALLSSLPAMTNVTIVCFLFLLIFAIVGVSFFKGAFGSCQIDDEELLEQIITKQDCLDNKGTWFVPTENFNSAATGMLTLLEMMTTEGWIDVMHAGLDAVPIVNDQEMQPKKGNRNILVIYFVLYMVFGSQFILNLFVGVIMDNFNKIKDKQEWGSLFVTEDQRCWIDAQRLGLARTLEKKIEAPEGSRGIVFNLVNHSIFEGAITFFIVFNTIVMASKHDGIDPKIEQLFENMNYIFAFIFNWEMILKLIGLGSQYFYSGWNVFDCLVVIGTDIGIILNFTSTGSSFSTAATVVRAFRIMRIVRLIRSQANLKIILDTLVNIIPSITNFITLMFLMIFIYAALGLNLFGLIVHRDYVTDKNNFQDIATAIIYLFRCATGEDWNKIMHELSLSVESGLCIKDQDYHVLTNNNGVTLGCGNQISKIYFISFLILISWLILNLSVAAVIEGLENAKQENTGIISGDDVTGLLEAWKIYDPKASGWINILDFICLLIELPAPFGDPETTSEWKKNSQPEFDRAKKLIYNKDSYYVNEERRVIVKNKDILKVLSAYKIQTYEGNNNRVHFKDIYQKLIKKVFLEEIEDFEISKYLKTKMKNQWLEKHKKLKELPKTGFKAHQSFASQIISQYACRHRFHQDCNAEHQGGANRLGTEYDNQSEKSDVQMQVFPKEMGQVVKRDHETARKIKFQSNTEFKIGFAEQNDEPQTQKYKNKKRVCINPAHHGIDLNLPVFSKNGKIESAQQKRKRKLKNKDQNPQEFDDSGKAKNLDGLDKKSKFAKDQDDDDDYVSEASSDLQAMMMLDSSNHGSNMNISETTIQPEVSKNSRKVNSQVINRDQIPVTLPLDQLKDPKAKQLKKKQKSQPKK